MLMSANQTEIDVRQELLAAFGRAGSLRKWALANGLSAAYASDVSLGKRSPGPSILKALGLERIEVKSVTYRRKPS